MLPLKNIICLVLLIPLLTKQDDKIISYIADPKHQDIRFYWKNDSGMLFGDIQQLKDYLTTRHRKLLFAMNGGMFKPDYSPVGLFIRDRQTLTPLDTAAGTGNFYLKPNAVLYITTTNEAVICQTADFRNDGAVKFATQSGPMLLIHGDIHPAFKSGSTNLNIRNGAVILPDGRLLLAMSEAPVSFYDFAAFFKGRGCREALYLDGFISRTYLPEKHWEQTDGHLGVIIGVSEPAQPAKRGQ